MSRLGKEAKFKSVYSNTRTVEQRNINEGIEVLEGSVCWQL